MYPTLAINLLQRLHEQSSQLHNFIIILKISSAQEYFIAMSAFNHS